MPGTKDMKFRVVVRPTGRTVRYSFPNGTLILAPDGRLRYLPPGTSVEVPEYDVRPAGDRASSRRRRGLMEPSYESIKFPGKAQIFYHPHGATPIEWTKLLASIGERLLDLHIVSMADPYYGKRGRAEYKVVQLDIYVPTEPGDPIVLVPTLEIVKEEHFGLGSELAGEATEEVGRKLNCHGWRVSQYEPDVASGRYVLAARLHQPECGGWLVPVANPARCSFGKVEGSFGPPGVKQTWKPQSARELFEPDVPLQVKAFYTGHVFYTPGPEPLPYFDEGSQLRADQLNTIVDEVNELSLSMKGIKEVVSTMPGERPRMREALAHTPSNPTNPPARIQEKSVSDKQYVCSHCGKQMDFAAVFVENDDMICGSCFNARREELDTQMSVEAAITTLCRWPRYKATASGLHVHCDTTSHSITYTAFDKPGERELAAWVFVSYEDTKKVTLREVRGWLDYAIKERLAPRIMSVSTARTGDASKPTRVHSMGDAVEQFGGPPTKAERDLCEQGPGIDSIWPELNLTDLEIVRRRVDEVVHRKNRFCKRCGHDYGCMCPREEPERGPSVNRCVPREPKVIL